MDMQAATCEARYEQLASTRLQFLDRARKCSELTIPTLVPPEAHGSHTVYYTPWQGIGARGVNTLSSKLLLSLLPPNSPFFRLGIDDFTSAQLAGEEGARAKIEEGLNKIERAVQTEIEGTGLRSPIFLALKHLIVAGNYFAYLPKDGGVKGYPLDRFVVKRDTMGNVLEAITLDEVSPLSLNATEQAALSESESGTKSESTDKTVKLYTKFYRDGKVWKSYQQIKGNIIEGSQGEWPVDKAPFMALRWTHVDGEDYGRSYVEEYIGDLISLEGLSKAIVEASAVAAKVVYLLNPNGVTRAKDLTKAESGDVIVGSVADVQALQTDKQADMRIAYEAAKTITDRLAMAFLMNTAIQRQAERVTAEEVRYMAGELEDALGGVYSILSQEFQLPLVIRVMDRMTKQKRLPALPKGIVQPQIVTGLEALGRGHDLSKYQMMIQALAPLGPEAMQRYMNTGDYIKRIGTSLGIDMDGLIKSDQQIAQEAELAAQQQQQAMVASMAEKAIPNAVSAIGKAAAPASQ
jgi:hypothetical protein